jgi:hypothetical protein
MKTHALLTALLVAPSFAQTAPDGLDSRKAVIVSDGTRMAAELYWPKAAGARKLPTVIMSHGWGGTVAALRRDAIDIAKAGYLVIAFDYRGWGASDSRVILTSPPPAERPNNRFTAEVREIREVVDPMDMTTDILNAIHFAAGEPMCDADRIGLWGSSFSGGLVVYAAAHDPRVKALHSQVPALDGRWVVGSEEDRKKTREEATQMARGELGYPAPSAKVIGNLRGAPVRAKFIPYYPVDVADRAPQCAMQFVVAEKEELFDNADHGIKAYQRAKGEKKLVSVPKITHYGIYYEARQEALRLAIEWFDKWLKK